MATDGNSDKFYNTFGLRPALNPDGTPVTIRMADADAKNFPNGKTYMLFEQKDGVGADAVLLTPGQALEAMNDAVNRIPNDRVHEVGPLSEAFRTYIDRASEMASQGDVSFDNVLKPNSLSPAGQAGRERLLNGNAGEGRAETIESNPEQFIRRNSGGAAPAV